MSRLAPRSLPEPITRLADILSRLPAEERAEVWRGIALNLAERLAQNMPEKAR